MIVVMSTGEPQVEDHQPGRPLKMSRVTLMLPSAARPKIVK
jgi:hypothetical protein